MTALDPQYSPAPRIRRLIFRAECWVLVLSLLSLSCLQALAQQEKDQEALYAVVHIDLDSSRTAQGIEIVQQYMAASRRDAGNLSMHLLQERGRPNHLTLIEGWQSDASYTVHLRLARTKQFRLQIQPLLGSPFDERLHYALPAPF